MNISLPNENISSITNSNIDIKGPNINKSKVSLRGKKPNLNANINGNNSGMNISVIKPKIHIYQSIPEIDNNRNSNEINQSITLKELVNGNVNDIINLKIKKLVI